MPRIASLLVGLAVYLQLSFASWGLLALANDGDPADPFGGHALCLAGESNTSRAAPSEDGPVVPAHDHLGFCCLWHPLPGVTPQTALTPVPVVYSAVAHGEGDAPAFRPGPRRGPTNARAPPIPA